MKLHNCHVMIDNNGTIVSQYRKLHLFDVSIPEKSINLRESDNVIGGMKISSPVETPAGSVGLLIASLLHLFYFNFNIYLNITLTSILVL